MVRQCQRELVMAIGGFSNCSDSCFSLSLNAELFPDVRPRTGSDNFAINQRSRCLVRHCVSPYYEGWLMSCLLPDFQTMLDLIGIDITVLNVNAIKPIGMHIQTDRVKFGRVHCCTRISLIPPRTDPSKELHRSRRAQ